MPFLSKRQIKGNVNSDKPAQAALNNCVPAAKSARCSMLKVDAGTSDKARHLAQGVMLALLPLMFIVVQAQESTSSLDQITLSTDVDATLIEFEDGIDAGNTDLTEVLEELIVSEPEALEIESSTIDEISEPTLTAIAAIENPTSSDEGFTAINLESESELELELELELESESESESELELELESKSEPESEPESELEDAEIQTATIETSSEPEPVEPEIAVAVAVAMEAEIAVVTAAEIAVVTAAENFETQTRINIENALLGWAYAWAKQDVNSYLDYYAANFTPENSQLSRADWVVLRKMRLLKPKKIELNLADIVLNVNTEPVQQVIFSQSYKSDTFHDEIIKSITFIQQKNQWKILTEQTIKVL
jgi:hypothetical protein